MRLTFVVLLSASVPDDWVRRGRTPQSSGRPSEDCGRGDRTRTYNRWFWRPVLCQLSYTPAAASEADPLFGLAVKRMAALPGTVLHQLDPVGIVLLVLACRIGPLLALGAGELDRGTGFDS